MLKIKPALLLLIIFLTIAGTYCVLRLIDKGHPVQIHKFDVQTEDLALKDFTLVSFDNHQYIQKNYYFELSNHEKNITKLTMSMNLQGKEIANLVAADPFVKQDKFYVDAENIINNVEIFDNSVLNVKISYVSDGKTKEYYEDVKLKDTIKKK